MGHISSLCNDIIERPAGRFSLSNSLSLSLTQTLFLNVCILSQHNKIWSPYSRRDSRVLKCHWRRETPLCDRRQRRDSMSEKKRERVCQSSQLMEPSFTKMLIIDVFVCVSAFSSRFSHTHSCGTEQKAPDCTRQHLGNKIPPANLCSLKFLVSRKKVSGVFCGFKVLDHSKNKMKFFFQIKNLSASCCFKPIRNFQKEVFRIQMKTHKTLL